jgi:hypothetical protein
MADTKQSGAVTSSNRILPSIRPLLSFYFFFLLRRCILGVGAFVRLNGIGLACLGLRRFFCRICFDDWFSPLA